jgi:tellurite resistance protein
MARGAPGRRQPGCGRRVHRHPRGRARVGDRGVPRQGRQQVLADLRHSVVAPFLPLSFITPMLLGAERYPYAPVAGKTIVIVGLVGTLLIGGWMTGQWIVGELDTASLHPGYLLPTVAGGFVGSVSAEQIDLRPVGQAAFGIGVLCCLCSACLC